MTGPENNERDKAPQPKIGTAQKVLRLISETDMLSFSPYDVHLIELQYNGRSRPMEFRVGDEVTIEPIEVPDTVIQQIAPSLDGLLPRPERSRSPLVDGQTPRHKIDDPEFLAWKEALPLPEMYSISAKEVFAQRGKEGAALDIPSLLLESVATGESRLVPLDVVELMAHGVVRPQYVEVLERQYDTFQHAMFRMEAKLSDYLGTVLKDMGMNPDSVIVESEGGAERLNLHEFDVPLVTASWRKNADGKVMSSTQLNIRQAGASKKSTIEQLEQAQKWLKRLMPIEPASMVREMKIRERLDFELIFPLLVEKVAKYGYRLGCKYMSIATGETAPVLYALNERGESASVLAHEYHLEDATEAAFLNVDNLFQGS